MKQRAKAFARGLLISCISLIVLALILEIALKLFVPVTDWPVGEFDPGVGLHRKPDQTGTWVLGVTGEVQGHYRFNNAGWNSIHDYSKDKPDDTLRIAVIGNSFVEALQVDVEESYPVLLERALQANLPCATYNQIEVYNFGFSGAPLSQYLNIMRYAAQEYHPDVYIITIYPVNDFDKSLIDYTPDAYAYFMTYRRNAQGEFEEVLPSPVTPSKFRRLMVKSALVRYVYGNLQVGAVYTRLVRAESSILDLEEELTALVRHIFGEYQRIAQDDNSQLLLVMDADRYAIYGTAAPSQRITLCSRITTQVSQQLGIELIDLTETFTQDFQAHGKRFEFSIDDHWNERGHALTSQVVFKWVNDNVCQSQVSAPAALSRLYRG